MFKIPSKFKNIKATDESSHTYLKEENVTNTNNNNATNVPISVTLAILKIYQVLQSGRLDDETSSEIRYYVDLVFLQSGGIWQSILSKI